MSLNGKEDSQRHQNSERASVGTVNTEDDRDEEAEDKEIWKSIADLA